ncbi:hypothetical protein PHET_05703 [Paragonimus heterotremus]|uniref:BHLH domain-containing protein n=1 Tax=Paragonimus heterotremus TaxID=100268 RepID=A0A8J4SXG7_9TREM|nr:hypothetical protein PHET_05703 [Paragonimus heterotremus]
MEPHSHWSQQYVGMDVLVSELVNPADHRLVFEETQRRPWLSTHGYTLHHEDPHSCGDRYSIIPNQEEDLHYTSTDVKDMEPSSIWSYREIVNDQGAQFPATYVCKPSFYNSSTKMEEGCSRSSDNKRDSGCYLMNETLSSPPESTSSCFFNPQSNQQSSQVLQPNTAKDDAQKMRPWDFHMDTNLFAQSNHSADRTRPTTSARSEQQHLRKQHQREQDKSRTRSLNIAFCRLRSCLPEIPKDTKLTKIRTLRYAISYIRQLMDAVDDNRASSIDQTSPKTSCVPNTTDGLSSIEDFLLKDSGFDSLFEK